MLIATLISQALFWSSVESACFASVKSCDDSSRVLCATDPPQQEVRVDSRWQVQQTTQEGWEEGDSCSRHKVSVCFWTCDRNSSCVGFNALEQGGSRVNVTCQIFDVFPQNFNYSNSCSFFKVQSNQTLNCFTPPPAAPVSKTHDWFLIQQRATDDSLFTQNWQAFKDGFGSPTGNFWLGLQRVYEMTAGRSCRIKFEGVARDGTLRVAEYSWFALTDEGRGYAIHAGGYLGNNTDILGHPVGGLLAARIVGAKFSTYDVDNELNLFANCAASRSGGWWYHARCDTTNFNGLYAKHFNLLLPSQATVPLRASRIWVRENGAA